MSVRPRDDRGSISPVLPVMAMVILLLGGLVIDAGRQLDLRARAIAYAQEAARAGASQIDPSRTQLVLIPERVENEVDVYCDAVVADGAVDSCEFRGILPDPDDGDQPLIVAVHVEMSTSASLLSMVGVRELRASGDGRARPFQGVREVDDQPDSGYVPRDDDDVEDGGGTEAPGSPAPPRPDPPEDPGEPGEPGPGEPGVPDPGPADPPVDPGPADPREPDLPPGEPGPPEDGGELGGG